MGRRHPLITGHTGLGGTGTPAQGVVRTSCKAHGEPSSSNNGAHRPGGDGESSPGGGRSSGQGAVDSAAPAIHCLTAWGQRRRNSCNALPHCLGAVGSANPAMHYLTAWGQWTVLLLQCTAPLPGGSGQCNSFNALPHCPEAGDLAPA